MQTAPKIAAILSMIGWNTMIVRVAAIAIVMSVAGVASAAAPPQGEPNTDARRAWCEARFKNCNTIARKPGFLGGARKFCNNPSDGPGCIGVCEKQWGKASDCVTRLDPNHGASPN
jgi:hypothetical protein